MLKLRLYVGLLMAAFGAVLLVTALADGEWGGLFAWAMFTALYILTESVVLLFHHERGLVGLSAGEAIFLPMMVALTFRQLVWAIFVGALVVNGFQLRRGLLKATFNIAQFGAAGALAGALFTGLGGEVGVFTPRTAAAAVAGVVAFAILTHLFVSMAIALAEGRSFFELSKSIASAVVLNLGVNICLGLLLGASYVAARWTLVIFPLPLAAFFFSYRALMRQASEGQRVEHLHAATRALAVSRSIDEAVTGFLRATREIVSTRAARVLVEMPEGLMWWGVESGGKTEHAVPLEPGPMSALIEELRTRGKPLMITEGSSSEGAALAEGLDSRSLVAVPLLDNSEVVGSLMVFDRLGADGFGVPEERLLEALANELVVTLDSYRLFEQVAEERERFRKIFDSSKEGVVLLDDAARVRAWNPAATRITGYAAAEMEGHVWSDFIVVRSQEHERLVGPAVTEVSPEVELELVTKEGPSRWISILSSPVQGQEKGWVVLIRDVTTEHILEESKSDFLSTISHELRTPLTTIKGSVQVLNRKKGEDQDPVQKQMLGVLQRGTDRLERLVLNLLFVSQLDVNEGVKIFPEEVDIDEVVKTRVAVMAMDHPQVTVKTSETPVMARVDRERTLQVIDHLVENAVKFSPEGAIEIEVGTEGGFAFVSVKDEGPGIPTVDQERIFERFVRLGHVLTRETQGPGVGLYIVKRAVEAMGGQVHLDSAPGRGATFTVTFPLASPVAVVETSA
jgi:PAS domain S-box-containing protein